MVSAHYFVKELMDMDHILRTFYCQQYLACDCHMTFFVHFLQSYRPWLMGENDFRSISCEIMDRFRSNFGSLLLVRSSVCQQFTVGVL